MFKRAFITASLVVAIAFMVGACGQDGGKSAPKPEVKSSTTGGGSDAQQALPEGHPPMPSDNEALKFRDVLTKGSQPAGGAYDPSQHTGAVGTGGSMSAKGKDVRLSDELRAKWSVVEIEVSVGDKKNVIEVKVGEKVKVDKTYSVLVDAFIPEYTMFEDHIGTRGDEPKNPAIRVELFEGDKSLARGWVFKKLPDFNSYQSDKLGVVLITPKGS